MRTGAEIRFWGVEDLAEYIEKAKEGDGVATRR